jgi:anti-sigma B factor antagonist
MTITAAEKDNTCTLYIEGRIDTLTAPQLEQAFAEHAENCDKMVFDFSKVDYISSAGLRVIVARNPMWAITPLR